MDDARPPKWPVRQAEIASKVQRVPPTILLAAGVVLDALAMLGVPWLIAEGPLSESTRRW